jgi:hypothetical protein
VILLDAGVPVDETAPVITVPLAEFVSVAPAMFAAQSMAFVDPGLITSVLNLNGELSKARLATVVPSSFTVKENTGVPLGPEVNVDAVEEFELTSVIVVADDVVVLGVIVGGDVKL